MSPQLQSDLSGLTLELQNQLLALHIRRFTGVGRARFTQVAFRTPSMCANAGYTSLHHLGVFPADGLAERTSTVRTATEGVRHGDALRWMDVLYAWETLVAK